MDQHGPKTLWIVRLEGSDDEPCGLPFLEEEQNDVSITII